MARGASPGDVPRRVKKALKELKGGTRGGLEVLNRSLTTAAADKRGADNETDFL